MFLFSSAEGTHLVGKCHCQRNLLCQTGPRVHSYMSRGIEFKQLMYTIDLQGLRLGSQSQESF